MKEEYTAPEMEVVELEEEDAILTSGICQDGVCGDHICVCDNSCYQK